MKGVPFVNCDKGSWKGDPFRAKVVYKRDLRPAEPPRINICWVPTPHHPPPPPKALHTATSQITYHTLSPPQRPLCVPRVLSMFSIIAIFIGIPSGSLCGSRREYHTGASSWPLNLRTVPTSFPGFSQREPGNEVAHRSTALNLPSSAQLTAFCTYRLDQLPYFLCFNLVLSLFSATGVSSLEFCFSCFVRVIVMDVLALILFWVCKKHSNLITSSLSFSSPPARKKESSARRPP